MGYRRDVWLLVVGMAVLVGIQFLPGVYIAEGITANLAVAFGFFIGVFSGGLGMGGVWLMVPLMVFLFGIGIKQAIGTALTAQVLITFVGSYRHLREKHTGMKISIPLIVGGIIGTPIGVYLNVISPAAVLEWMYAALLAIIAAKMGYEMVSPDGAASETSGRNLSRELFGGETIERLEKTVKERADRFLRSVESLGRSMREASSSAAEKAGEKIEKVAEAGVDVEEHVHEEIEDDYHGEEYRVDTLSLAAAGVGFGVINSLLGTSTTVIVPFLDIFMKLNTHVAMSTSLINVTGISIPASLNHVVVGNVMFGLAGVVAAGGIAGAILGSDLNEIAPERLLQLIMVVLLIGMAYYMLPVRPF